ncbi:MAG: DciA family protein [Planctomycetota bacterium]
MKPDQAQQRLDLLRQSRSLPRKDLSLGFMTEQFNRDVEKPYRQLGDLAELWREIVPDRLLTHCRLVGLSRGTLHVEADHAAAHFEIDRLLRSGLQTDLIKRHKGPAFRRVQVRLAGRSDSESVDPRRRPPAADTNPAVDPDKQPPLGRGVADIDRQTDSK